MHGERKVEVSTERECATVMAAVSHLVPGHQGLQYLLQPLAAQSRVQHPQQPAAVEQGRLTAAAAGEPEVSEDGLQRERERERGATSEEENPPAFPPKVGHVI